MYLPRHFEETRPAALHGLMRARPLATLVTGDGAGGFDANHIPLYLDPAAGPHGVLRGHVARANPLWRLIGDGAPALAIFQGDEAYVSPSWYPSKHEHGKAVPTWNYVVVHARGTLRAIDDAAWLRGLLDTLTGEHESAFAQPWSVADAPADFIEKMVAAVVGIELPIEQIAGKWKVSQNQPAANRAGAAQGLRERGQAGPAAMARLVAGYPDEA
ncbi:FMN-binding negative transcriptional regulator [Bordetella sp. BOR01]|uniref:FMN-binding negative transcriptional regulator n=1 Tax=Bordetella sp. BOR01 TaxID=2854779 RepID=UPI001C448E8C|nr:FMN-binding negative transcriptional regulator [Bordetella sp. BOR01]MBV7485065.1 FMN-binding negative transcriptional regulator [Bordetella sp. BOR01]